MSILTIGLYLIAGIVGLWLAVFILVGIMQQVAKTGLYYKHTELAMLDWPVSKFNKLVANGSIRRPEAYKLVLKVCGFSVELG